MFDRIRLRTLLAALLVSLLPQLAAAEGKFKVVTTFTVLADMARQVAGDAAEVESITKPGAEIHNYQPTPGDILKARDAQLILRNGMNLELWFERFLQRLQGVPAVTLSEGVEPMGIAEGPYSGKPNPHAWMSPDAAMIYIDNIRDALSEYDAANAETYKANAEAYKARIQATIAPIRERLQKLSLIHI